MREIAQTLLIAGAAVFMLALMAHWLGLWIGSPSLGWISYRVAILGIVIVIIALLVASWDDAHGGSDR